MNLLTILEQITHIDESFRTADEKWEELMHYIESNGLNKNK